MRKVTLIRLGVAAGLATIGVVGAIAAGCSGDDTTPVTPPPKTDSGTPDAISGHDAQPDTNPGTDAGPLPQNAKLIVVHAAPAVPTVRVCFAQGQQDDGSDGTVTALPALPHTNNPPPLPPEPGIPPGTGGTFPDITDLSGLAITPYVIFADKIATQSADAGTNEKTCVDMIGANGAGGSLHLGVDYLKLPTIPKNTFLQDNTYLLSLVGCLPDVADAGFNEAMCGAGYNPATGNVAVGIAKLDRATMPDGGPGVQFAHRSSAVEGTPGAYPVPDGDGGTTFMFHPPASAGVVPGFVVTVDGGDEAGAIQQFVTLQPQGSAPAKYAKDGIVPSTATTMSEVNLADPSTLFGVLTLPPDGGAPNATEPYPIGDMLALPLSVIQALSYGGATPAVCANGANCTFILTGDPSKQPLLIPNPDGGATPVMNPAYDGRGLHFLAFPNDPPVQKYQ